MPVVKVIELLSESSESGEAAAQQAGTETAKTVRNIKSVYIKEFTGIVEDDKIVMYRVNVKVSFVVQD